MDLDRYQLLCSRTLLDKPSFSLSDHELMIAWNVTGLAGETGEFLDLMKKAIFHRHEIPEERIVEELGDILWYLAAIATKLGYSLDFVAEKNIEKLKKRYPDGFNLEASIKQELKARTFNQCSEQEAVIYKGFETIEETE